MNKIHLVTFGNEKFKNSKERIRQEAMDTGWFDEVIVYEPSMLMEYNRSFEDRGAGYWWWKALIQSIELNKLEKNDILLYLDAGFYINKHANKEFYKYVEIINENAGLLSFETGCLEKHYTKRDVFKLLNCDTTEYANSYQIGSGMVMYRKNKLSIDFVEYYKNISFVEHAINNAPSFNEDYPGFIEHKNDQSVFGLLIKKHYKNENIKIYNMDYQSELFNDMDSIYEWFNTKDLSKIINLKYPFYPTRLWDSTLINFDNKKLI
jgi:hypothetical protein